MTEPVFAVVGHPNKGKSSIVATLAQDDSVRVGPEAGTTTAARRYPMRVDGQVMYTLVDTPGFQRARRALAWMRDHAPTAEKRPAAARAFVEHHRHTGLFPDEVELLTPITQGAGIIYVVDGSRPYGPEYEAEMEVLRWTGRPSMALINPITAGDHTAQWEAALGQFFRVVVVFNAMTAEFYKRLDLLRTFGQLHPAWRPRLARAVAVLEQDRKARHARAARAIADMVADMLTARAEKLIDAEGTPAAHEAQLRERYRAMQRRREAACRREVEAVYDHRAIDRREEAVALPEQDLFATDQWVLWGLTRRQVVAASAAAGAGTGAAAGAALDITLGGASLLGGTLLGGALGAASASAAALRYGSQLAALRVGPVHLGGRRVTYGPNTSANFPFVLLGRAMLHHARVAGRTHAHRDPLSLGPLTPGSAGETADSATRSASPSSEGGGASGGAAWHQDLLNQRRAELARLFAKLASPSAADAARGQLTQLIGELTEAADHPPPTATG